MDFNKTTETQYTSPTVFDNFFTDERKKKVNETVSNLDKIANVPLLGLGGAKVKGENLECQEAVEMVKTLLSTLNSHYWEGKVTLISVLLVTIESAGPGLSKHMNPDLKETLINFLKEQSTIPNMAYERAVINCLTIIAVYWKDIQLTVWITENAKQKIYQAINNDKENSSTHQLLDCEREKKVCDVVQTHLTSIIKCFVAHSEDSTITPIIKSFCELITDASIPWRGRATIFEPLEKTLKSWNPASPISINHLSRCILEFSKELKESKQHNASNYIGSIVRWFDLRPEAFKKDSHLVKLLEENEFERFQKKLFDVKISDNTIPETMEVDQQSSMMEKEKDFQQPEEASLHMQNNIFDAFPIEGNFKTLQKHVSSTNPRYGMALQQILMDGDCEDEEFQKFIKRIRNDDLQKDEFKKLVESYVKQTI